MTVAGKMLIFTISSLIIVTTAAPAESESLFSLAKVTRMIGTIANSVKCIGSRLEAPKLEETTGSSKALIQVTYELASNTKRAMSQCWVFYMTGTTPTDPESSWVNVVKNAWGIAGTLFRMLREAITNYRNGNIGLLDFIRGKSAGEQSENIGNEKIQQTGNQLLRRQMGQSRKKCCSKEGKRNVSVAASAAASSTDEKTPEEATGRRTLGLLPSAFTAAASLVGVPVEEHEGEHDHYLTEHNSYNTAVHSSYNAAIHGSYNSADRNSYNTADYGSYSTQNSRRPGYRVNENEQSIEAANLKASFDQYKEQQRQREIDDLKLKLQMNQLKQELSRDEYRKDRMKEAIDTVKEKTLDAKYDSMQYQIQENRNLNINNQMLSQANQRPEIHIHERPRKDKVVVVAPPPPPATIIQQSVNVETGDRVKKHKKNKS